MTSKQKVKRMAVTYEEFHYSTRHGWQAHSSCFKDYYKTSGQWTYTDLPGVDDTFAKKYPSQDEWQQLAEDEAVISPLQKCAISIQTDDPATNSWTLLEIYLA